MRLAIVVALAGCSYDGPYELRVALGQQTIARGDIGVPADTAISVGDLWVSVRADGDVDYPVVAGAGDQLVVESPFEAPATLRDKPRDSLLTWTRLSKDTEPPEMHPATQYATVFVDVHLAGADSTTLELDLDVPRPTPCEEQKTEVSGTVRGCLAACAAEATTPLVHVDDGFYRAGPFQIWLQLVQGVCNE